MKESEVEKVLVSEVKRLGGRAYKWVSPGNDGVPDRIVIFPNEPPVFVELKTEDGKPTALQRVQMNRLRKLGQCVRIVYGPIGLMHFFEELGFLGTAHRIAERYDLWEGNRGHGI